MPMHRITMQSRRANKLEEERQKFIQSTVTTIYRNTLQTADTTDASFYKYANEYAGPNDFTKNALDITEQLKILFPSCKVTYTSYVMDRNGIWHDETTITEVLKPFIVPGRRQEVIVIDWT